MNHAIALRAESARRRFAMHAAGLFAALIVLGAGNTRAEPAATLAVLPFEIYDTSQEVGPANRHDAMLSRTTSLVRDEIAAAQLYRVVPGAETEAAIAAVNPGTYLRNCNGCESDIAKRLGARYVLIGWIYKVSTLVLTLHIDMKDAETGRTVYAHVFDFRGDNERAYAHAAKALVQSLKDALQRSGKADTIDTGSTPIKIAIFDFELEDFSAAGGAGVSPVENKYLAQATEEAKHALADSGRYMIVPTAGADLSAAKGFGLRNCRGCEAAIAAKLGADQAMLGVVTKISMTEYTVTVQLTDAKTGTAIKSYTTGLRMGADYSWIRGVTWLMAKRVLASKEK